MARRPLYSEHPLLPCETTNLTRLSLSDGCHLWIVTFVISYGDDRGNIDAFVDDKKFCSRPLHMSSIPLNAYAE